jgi:radical SAM superfamily enzyme YgiQ (UPF0313 family)
MQGRGSADARATGRLLGARSGCRLGRAMHCCLITAPTVTEFRSRGELVSGAVQLAASQPQLGILSVAAVLEGCGDRPDIVDANSAYLKYADTPDGLRSDAFAAHLAELAIRSNADLYGFSSICSTYPQSVRVAREIKKRRPYAMILFGGPQASVVDVATLTAFPFVDFVLRGEVEHTLPCLVAELHQDYDYSRVGGLTYRDGTAVRRNANAPVIEDLDSFPAPAYHLSSYLQNAKAALIELGRGCPFSCTFCSTNDFFRRKFRLRSPARVLKEMREIWAVYAIRHFELVHDMFTVDRKRVVAFCEEMLGSNEGFTWDCSARTDCVDEELLELMARSGCRSIFFGIETGSRKMQRVIDKDLDLERAKDVLAISERLRLKTTVSLITGFPEEEWEDVRETLRIFMDSARHAHSRPQLNLLAPLAGTPIHAAHKHEMVLEDLCSDMSHQGLTQNQEDLALIRSFPEIFPNFYLIPAKRLNRDVLFELREFLSMTVECFRWLLGAIDQVTDLLRFLEEWRTWRQEFRGELVGSDLRRYYVGTLFRGDFLRFMRQHRLLENPAILALVRTEETMKAAEEGRGSARIENIAIPVGSPLQKDDLPLAEGTARVLRLDYNLEEIVSAIATRTNPKPQGIVFYATRVDHKGSLRLVEVSSTVACMINVCDGTRTVGDVLESLGGALLNVDEDARSFAAERLLTGIQAAGFVGIFRAQSTVNK